jgi:hypothetical protein
MSTETDTSITGDPPTEVYPVTSLSYAEFTWLLRDCPPEAPKSFDYNALNEHEYAALSALHARGENKRPSYQTLAANMKTSDSTAKRAVKSLQAKGWIVLLERGCVVCHASNRYGIQGVPPGVRETLARLYSAKPVDWFDSWCQTDHSPYVPVTLGLVPVRHEGLCQRDTQRVKDTRGKDNPKTEDENREVKKEAGVSQTLEESNLSTVKELPLPANENSGDLSTVKFPLPAKRKITPYSRQPKYSEQQYYRNDSTSKVARGPIENLPAGWGKDDISEFWLNSLEVDKLRTEGRLHETQD